MLLVIGRTTHQVSCETVLVRDLSSHQVCPILFSCVRSHIGFLLPDLLPSVSKKFFSILSGKEMVTGH